MAVKLLTEQHLRFLSLKAGLTGSCVSIHVKMPHCSKSQVAAQLQPHNYQVSKKVVQEIRFGDIAVIRIKQFVV